MDHFLLFLYLSDYFFYFYLKEILLLITQLSIILKIQLLDLKSPDSKTKNKWVF